MIKKLKNAFISGIFVLLPLYVTYIVIRFLLENVGEPASQLFFGHLPFVKDLNGWFGIILSTISILFVVFFIMFCGWLSNYFLGKFFIGLAERIIQKIPLISAVHKTVKQIVDTFGQDQKAVFRQAVLVQFPRDGLYSIGFLTNTAKGEVQEKTKEEVVNIFIPTTPNPTTGFLVMAPKEQVVYLDMSVGEAMKAIISGGAVIPTTPDTKTIQEEPQTH